MQRIDVETGDGLTVWDKPHTVWNIGVSADTGHLAVTYGLREDLHGIDIVQAETWQATLLHFSQALGMPAISPDGRWVAFASWTRKQPTPIGVIVAADGTDLRYFVPEAESRDALILEFLRSRLDSTLRAIWWHEDVPPRPVRRKRRPDAPSGAEIVKRAHDILERVGGEQKAALLQEAVAYGHAAIYPWLLKGAEAEERQKFALEAREHLAAFLKAYPDHPLGPVLEGEIADLLREERAP